MNRNKKLLAGVLIMSGSVLFSSNTLVEATPADLAGVELSHQMDMLDRADTAQQLAEGQAKAKEAQKMQENLKKQQMTGKDVEAEKVTLLLQKVVTTPSQIITDSELDKIVNPYLFKNVTEKELYAIRDGINKLYQKKGNITCRAFLEPQTLKDGVLKVTLIEGKNGDTTITGAKFTKEGYIKNRLHLKSGKIPNINVLTQDMLLFNASNDCQLRLAMQAGKKPGTTDYILKVVEPQQHNVTIFADNAGNPSTGYYREGIYYTCKSLSGERDALTIGGVRSQGLDAFSTTYSRPIGTRGTKLYVSYNSNGVNQKFNFASGGYYTKGHATSVSVGFLQPVVITPTMRTELSFDYTRQGSVSDGIASDSSMNILDDIYNDFTLGFSMTNFGGSSVIYHKHSFIKGGVKKNASSWDDDNPNYFIYKLDGLYQKAYQHGQTITARGSFQKSSNSLRNASSKAFYIGGFYTVRGYKENYLGGSDGINLSIEYSIPLTKDRKTNLFVFTDYGRLYGEAVESGDWDNYLVSAGIGIRTSIGRNASLTCNIARAFNTTFTGKDEEINRYRVNFLAYAHF